MIELKRAQKEDRLMKALTGLRIKEFDSLKKVFKRVNEKQPKKKNRQRKEGGGMKSVLRTAEEQLFFILFYMKVYPTYDVAGLFFGVNRSQPCRWVKKYLPILEESLGQSLSLPKRQIKSIGEFLQSFPSTKDVFIDGTERAIQRPKKEKAQKKTIQEKRNIIPEKTRFGAMKRREY